MNSSLDGVRILLTGVSRGVGYASARLLIENGAHVFGIARDEERLTAAASKLSEHEPGTFASRSVDLVVPEAPAIVASEVGEHWGALDIVIHNAGVMLHEEGGVMAEPDGILERTLEVNLLAPVRLSRPSSPS